MARPIKNNCDYFPHFTTMRNHKKVKALRAKFGQILGYAFWSMIIEYLTEQDGIEIENSEIEIEMFAGELGVSATEIRSMIDYCIKIELLFLTDDNFIYSDSLNELLQPVFDKRKLAKESSKTRKRHNNGSYCGNNTELLGVSATEIPQIKEEGSKENKIIVNKEESKEEIKITSMILEYPLKTVKEYMQNDISQIEIICINNSIEKTKLLYYLNSFFKKLENEGEVKKSIKEARSHFARWLNLELKKEINNGSNRQIESDTRERVYESTF